MLKDQEALSFASYPSMQFSSVDPPMPSPPYYSSPNCYSQYGEDWFTSSTMYELRKGLVESSYDVPMEENAPPVCKRPRQASHGSRVKGEELCVVCGDKASGYHYNALTCEGCKGRGCCSNGWGMSCLSKKIFMNPLNPLRIHRNSLRYLMHNHT